MQTTSVPHNSDATRPQVALSSTDRLRRHYLRNAQTTHHRWRAAHAVKTSPEAHSASLQQQPIEAAAQPTSNTAASMNRRGKQDTSKHDSHTKITEDITDRIEPLSSSSSSSSLYFAAGMAFDVDVTAALQAEACVSHRRRYAFLTAGTLTNKREKNVNTNDSDSNEDDAHSCAVRLFVITRATLATLLAPIHDAIQRACDESEAMRSRSGSPEAVRPKSRASPTREDDRPWQTNEAATNVSTKIKAHGRQQKKKLTTITMLLRRMLRNECGFLSALQGELMQALPEEQSTCEALPLLGLQLHTFPKQMTHSDKEEDDVLYWSDNKNYANDTEAKTRHAERHRVLCVIALAYPCIMQGNIARQLPWLSEGITLTSLAQREQFLSRILRDLVQSLATLHAHCEYCHGHLEVDNVFLRADVLDAMRRIIAQQVDADEALTKWSDEGTDVVVLWSDGVVYGKVELAMQRAMARQLILSSRSPTRESKNMNNNTSHNDSETYRSLSSATSSLDALLAALVEEQETLRVFTLTTTTTPPPPECIMTETTLQVEKAGKDTTSSNSKAAPLRRRSNTRDPRCLVRQPACDVWQLGTLAVVLAEGSVGHWSYYQHNPLIYLTTNIKSDSSSEGWSDDLVRFVRRCTTLQAEERPSAQSLLDEDAFLRKSTQCSATLSGIKEGIEAGVPDFFSECRNNAHLTHDQELCYMTSEALLHAFGRAALHRCRRLNEQLEMKNLSNAIQPTQQIQQGQDDESNDEGNKAYHDVTASSNAAAASMRASQPSSYMPSLTEHGTSTNTSKEKEVSPGLAHTYSTNRLSTATGVHGSAPLPRCSTSSSSLHATHRFMHPNATTTTSQSDMMMMTTMTSATVLPIQRHTVPQQQQYVSQPASTTAAAASTASQEAVLLDYLTRMQPVDTHTSNSTSSSESTSSEGEESTGRRSSDASAQRHTLPPRQPSSSPSSTPPLITDHTSVSSAGSIFLAPLGAAVEACRTELRLQHALLSYDSDTDCDSHEYSTSRSRSTTSSSDDEQSYSASRHQVKRRHDQDASRTRHSSRSSSTLTSSSSTSSSSLSTCSITAIGATLHGDNTVHTSAQQRQDKTHKASDARHDSREPHTALREAAGEHHRKRTTTTSKRDIRNAQKTLEEQQEALTAVLQAFWNLSRECPLGADVWALCLLRHLASEPRFAECMSQDVYDSLKPFLVSTANVKASNTGMPTNVTQDSMTNTRQAAALPRIVETNPIFFHQHEVCKWYVATARLLEREEDVNDYSVA